MALQFTSGPFAGSYTTNTFTPGRAQPRPTPSQGTPYGGQAFQGNLGGQYNAQRANGPSHGAYAPGTGMPPGQFTGAMQPKPAYQPPASAYQPRQGPYISTTYAYPGGGWGHSPQPPVQQGSYQPRVSRSAYRPAPAGMRFGR